MSAAGDDEVADRIILGRIVGLYGVRGWVKVYSWTRPRENILAFDHWWLRDAYGISRPVRKLDGRTQGKGLVAALEGVTERDTARRLIGSDVLVPRNELPPAEPGEYYWHDLEGLRVRTTGGADLGTVDHLLETGANDVLVVRGERERLVPFVPERFVTEVDLESGWITVDWDEEF